MSALSVGDEAWMIFTARYGKGDRRTVLDAGRVRVLEVPDVDRQLRITYRVEAIRCAHGFGVLLGERFEARRDELYDVRSADEHAAFGHEVARLWPSPFGAVESTG